MKTAGKWQREHNQRAARTLEQKQRGTLAIAKAMRVPFIVGRGPLPPWLMFRRAARWISPPAAPAARDPENTENRSTRNFSAASGARGPGGPGGATRFRRAA